ncbi:MAG: hypothetical protein KAQ88_07725, partial [Hyphomicrobiaceae bacterium]|nr:hypothetical protein [Hyphomicrobiaceae bacterium]
MRGFPQEARREISLGVDGPQQVDCVHPTFDKIGDRFAILGRDLLAADHEVEDRIVDEWLERHQKPVVYAGEFSDGRFPLGFDAEPLFDRDVQFFELRRNLP